MATKMRMMKNKQSTKSKEFAILLELQWKIEELSGSG
jgi:hypothetical protein